MERKSAVGELERDALLRLESGKLEMCSMGRPNGHISFRNNLGPGGFSISEAAPRCAFRPAPCWGGSSINLSAGYDERRSVQGLEKSNAYYHFAENCSWVVSRLGLKRARIKLNDYGSENYYNLYSFLLEDILRR